LIFLYLYIAFARHRITRRITLLTRFLKIAQSEAEAEL